MKNLITTLIISLFGGIPMVGLIQPALVYAEDTKQPQLVTPTAKTTPVTNYLYTAKADDSYSVLARKAIQTYGLENKVNLSGAQIIFAETNLTKIAGSPLLNKGQKLEIIKDNVKSWIEKAQKLTDSQKQAWNYYVKFVDFDTRDNG